MRVDLHCHSKYSDRPTIWLMQKLGCPESFTEPLRLYEIQKAAGMSAVTITDHNDIRGCLEIAEFADTFISDEITTYFPEDGCKIHVLAYDITEEEFREIQKARENVYDLVSYFAERRIRNACAHPFYAVNDRLKVEHLEKILLLFKNLEVNGDQNRESNEWLVRLAESLDRETIERLAEKHRLEPRHAETWRKNITGGSDDHGSLHLARTYTEVPEARTIDQFLAGIDAGRAKVVTRPGGPKTFARNIYGIAYQYYDSKTDLSRDASKDVLLRFVDRTLSNRPQAETTLFSRVATMIGRRRLKAVRPSVHGLVSSIRRIGTEIIDSDPRLREVVRSRHAGEPEEAWFDFVNRAANRLLKHNGEFVFDGLSKGRVFDAFHAIGSASALYSTLAPYFIGYSLFQKERSFAFEATRAVTPSALPPRRPRVLEFTDTFHEVNGVAEILRQEVAAADRLGLDLEVVTCYDRFEPRARVRNFLPVGTCAVPEYREVALSIPPILEMLDHERNPTHIHTTTPGPMGLAALAIARILNVPISGCYHTAFPEYARRLTGSPFLEDLTWRFMLWYYDQLDLVRVPSRAVGEELVRRGLRAEKVKPYPRGIDVDRFHVRRRDPERAARHGVDPAKTRILYVGRISKEKSLDVLADAFLPIAASRSDVQLVLVGDGPYRAELAARLAGAPVAFTGYLAGEDLSVVYASCDLFAFPSTTDTFGNVILEAQASGLPVIATDAGGPCENLLAGRTGLVVPGGDARALREAMEGLIRDPERRARMGREARAYAEGRDFASALSDAWDSYFEETMGPPDPSRRPLDMEAAFGGAFASAGA